MWAGARFHTVSPAGRPRGFAADHWAQGDEYLLLARSAGRCGVPNVR